MNLLQAPIDGIIFDVDGTLWDTTEVLSVSWNEIIRSCGITDVTITPQNLKNTFGLPIPGIADKLMPHIDVNVRRAVIDDCCRLQTPVLKKTPGTLFEGVRRTLETLSKTVPLFVVSNCEKGYIETLIETCRFEGIFTDFECFGNTRLPKAGSMRLLIERNGLQSPVYVGDTQGDLEACEQAGVPFVFASYGFGDPQKYDAKIEKPQELLTLFATA